MRHSSGRSTLSGGKARFTVRSIPTNMVMVQDAERETGPVWAQETDPRTTRLGKILRRTGLDEIPQMFNLNFCKLG